MEMGENTRQGEQRIPEDWVLLNGDFTNRLYLALNETFTDKDKMVSDIVELRKFEGTKVEVDTNCVDPHILGLRRAPTPDGESLCTIDEVPLKSSAGAAVPCFIIAVFFQIRNSNHVRSRGNLRMPGRARPMDIDNNPPPPPKRAASAQMPRRRPR